MTEQLKELGRRLELELNFMSKSDPWLLNPKLHSSVFFFNL